MNVKIRNSFPLALGGNLLALLLFMMISAGVSFLLHLPVTATALPLSMILAGGFTYAFIARGHTFLWSFLSSILIVILCCLLSSLIIDHSSDAYYYHYNAVIMMAEGWNPTAEPPFVDSLWNQHYAKGMEMMQTVIFTFTSNLQSTKSLNLILILSAALLTWFTLGEVFTGISGRWKVALCLMVTFNPVVICQIHTAYNDHMLWSETVLTCCCFLLLWKNSRNLMTYLLLMMVLTLGINSKFTHFYYLGAGCMFYAVWCLCARRYDILLSGMLTVTGAIIMGAFIVGYNPYITNTVGYGNPFYPLIGSDVDIMTSNTPQMLQGCNRFTSFLMTLFSTTNHPWAYFRGSGFTLYDCVQSYTVDSRINGFGLLMAPTLICGLILMLCNRASGRWWIVYFFFLILGFTFEQSWWARYVPFLWALVIIPVLNYAVRNHKDSKLRRRIKRSMAYLILALVFLNASLALTFSLCAQYSYTSYINYISGAQKESGRPIKVANVNIAFQQSLKEQGIKYLECDYNSITKEPDQTFLIYRFGHQDQDVVALLPAEEYPELYRKPETLGEIIRDYPVHSYKNFASTE